jgi:hypothetical protein
VLVWLDIPPVGRKIPARGLLSPGRSTSAIMMTSAAGACGEQYRSAIAYNILYFNELCDIHSRAARECKDSNTAEKRVGVRPIAGYVGCITESDTRVS